MLWLFNIFDLFLRPLEPDSDDPWIRIQSGSETLHKRNCCDTYWSGTYVYEAIVEVPAASCGRVGHRGGTWRREWWRGGWRADKPGAAATRGLLTLHYQVRYLPVPSKSDPDQNKSRSDPQHLLHQHIMASKHEKYQGCRSALIFLQIWIKLVFSMRIRIKIQLLFYSNANPSQEPALKTFL